jgi:type VI secretion system secreted protein VgrG
MQKRTIFDALTLPLFATIVVGAAACSSPSPDSAATSQASSELGAPALGTVGSFAVLGGSTVTNTGATTIEGSLGVSPGLAITGFPPGLVSGGTTHAGDAVALQAQTDTATAYDALAAQACTVDLTGKDLGGLTLVPGVYCFSSSAQLTGALVLDAGGKSDAVFVFKTASTLTTASNASVRVINGGSDCNVFWKIGSSATIGTGTAFAGSILALASITLTTGATVSGRALARTGAVTMDDNAIALPICAKPAVDAGVPDAAPPSDAGVPDAAKPDSGVPPVDAGTPPADAGTPPSDAGTGDSGTGDTGTGTP